MTEKRTLDWERIEAQYRAGVMSIREIAKEHQCSDAAIRQKAKAGGWERDLTGKVKAAAAAKLLRVSLRAQPTSQEARSDAKIVDEASDDVVDMVRAHRHRGAKAQAIVRTLTEQLTLAIGSRETFQAAIEDLTKDDKTEQRYNALMRAVSLPVHISAAKDLATAMRTLNGVERQAYGLADVEDPTPPDTGGDKVTPVDAAMAEAKERIRIRNEAAAKA